ncbi:MAG TPA: polysaccharide biosynthesis/export family protein [Phycisphaerae bacterium]|nr:polysaccharide biosynthesis/export family protein [Phycisphaerae bacterium]
MLRIQSLQRNAGGLAAGLGLLLFFAAGCASTAESPASSAPVESAPSSAPGGSPEALTIRESDVLKISFPGAANLDTQQTVRRDGRITLTLIGEVIVTGKTPAQLEQELIKLYSTQLVSKEVTVTVVSSSVSVFVTGAVMKPGKILVDHPLSLLEAVMEAGGFDEAKANTKAVVVIRNEGGRTKNYTVNLQLVLDGKQNEPFYLQPSDIVRVPEKFSWF